MALSLASHGSYYEKKVALYGVAPDKYAKSALYLTDENRPLSISGNTLLKGKCYLPKAGVRTAYINQQSFTRSKLVEGATLESDQYLPKLHKKYVERLDMKELLKTGVEISEKDIIINSFYNDTYLLKSSSLENITIKNNVIIYSTGTLKIENSVQLENVIVAGQKVIVKEGFKGNLQVFAEDTIIVETNVHLRYPSSLTVYGKSNHSRIEVREKSIIEGIILIPENEAEFLGNLVTIQKGATVKGQVYAGGLVDHQGTAEGSIICRRFFLKTPSTLYENHLLDATIDNSLLSRYYVASPILSDSDKKIIVKWLK